MSMKRWGLWGAIAAVVVAGGAMTAGGAGILFQAVFRATGTGATDRTAMAKLRDTVSVKDYGAVGDGVTSDETAVNNAVTVAGSILKVHLPCPGTYKTTTRGTLACNGGATLDWDTVATPYLIAHRGDINIGAPENTIPGFDYSASFGPSVVLETDVQMSVDGALFLLHDSTTDRTTGSAGSIPAGTLTFDQLRALDASFIYNPSSIFTGTRIPAFAEYLRKYGGRNLLLPEVKDELTQTGTAMAQMVVKFGLQRSVAIQCFSTGALTAVKAVDSSIKTVLTSGSQVTPSAAVAAGVWAVYIDRTAVDAAYVTSMHAVGVKVLTYNNGPYIFWLEQAVNSFGVDGVTSDDASVLPWVNAYTPRSPSSTQPTVNPPYGTTTIISSGWRPAKSNAVWTNIVASGYLTWGNLGTVANDFTAYFLPGLKPSAALSTTQTIKMQMKAVATPTTPDTSRWMGIRFCWSEDVSTGTTTSSAGASNVNGYMFAYRQNGLAELNKVVNGVTTQLNGVNTWNTYAAAATFQLKIDITATQITVTRVDTGQTFTVTDSTFARTGMISNVGSGVVPGLGATTLTY